jgi:hypothetical protein
MPVMSTISMAGAFLSGLLAAGCRGVQHLAGVRQRGGRLLAAQHAGHLRDALVASIAATRCGCPRHALGHLQVLVRRRPPGQVGDGQHLAVLAELAHQLAHGLATAPPTPESTSSKISVSGLAQAGWW